MKFKNRVQFFIFLQLISVKLLFAQSADVKPYLQNAEPTSMVIMWETTFGNESTVLWGLTSGLGNSTSGSSVIGSGSTQIHTTSLTNLQPSTKYFYRVKTGNYQSDLHQFVTPPEPQEEKSFSLIALSDMQSHPTQFGKIVSDGIIKYSTDNLSGNLADDVSLIMLPGDLVGHGYEYYQWADHFFKPAANLFSDVPIYPVIGNHDRDAYSDKDANPPFISEADRVVNYKKYFDLPTNGTPATVEEWWYKDISNVRIIGLNSIFNANQTQLDWLAQVLNDTKNLEHIDFVFAQMHHPHQSELWLQGESKFSGKVMNLLENFSTATGKPTIQFFGHTHGYSRGQSRDHGLVMVNVGSGGGALDNWGEFDQADYDAYSVSQDEFGFLVINVTAGDYPTFELKRMGMGKEGAITSYVQRDEMLVKRYNTKPETPSAVSPIGTSNSTVLKASPFSDFDGDSFGSAHFQVSRNAGFTDLVVDDWKQDENWYYMQNTQAGDDLTDITVNNLVLGSTYYWRVRYRDKSLAWSDWSTATTFNYSNQINNKPIADFTADETIINVDQSVTFSDVSANNPTSLLWLFEGGNPATSTVKNPIVQYSNPGTYKVTLEATNQYGTDTKMIEQYITVLKKGMTGDTVAYYPFNFNANDTSGNERDGVATSVVFLKDPLKGNVASFDGNAFIDVQTGTAASAGMPKKDITVAAWVKVNDPDEWGGFVGLFQDNGAEEFGWVLGTKGKQFSFAMTTTGNPMTYLIDNAEFEIGQWYHVAATYDGAILNLYVDGDLTNSSSAQSGDISYPSTGWLTIGRYKDNNEDDGHAGALDDVLILNKALTNQEIQVIAKGELTSAQSLKTILGGQLVVPNPATNKISVGAKLRGNLEVEIFSSGSGKRIISFNMEAGDFVDLSFLPRGLYIVNVIHDQVLYQEKFVKY